VLIVVACRNSNNKFVIINVQNVVLFTNAEEIAVKCHFCMMCAMCVRKGVFILILGSIYKRQFACNIQFPHNTLSYDVVERGNIRFSLLMF
jgi:hypothetical protein